MNELDLVTVSEYIITLIEQIRCKSCWQKEGKRVRCACGIAACVDCTPCTLCPDDTKPDISLTSRVTNVNYLLHVYANTFDTDVCTRLENSTRLKLEKKIFPECIQAPAKYYNKKKTEFRGLPGSRRNTLENSERQLSHKATDIVPDSRKDDSNTGDSFAHVREWLDTNAKMTLKTNHRRPLSEINVNGASVKQQSMSLRTIRISNVPQKRRLNQSVSRKYRKRSKLDEILPFIETDGDKNAGPRTPRCNNNQNSSDCSIQPMSSDGMQFLVMAEIHAPPLIRKTGLRNDGGDGGGGSEGGGSGGSTGSSDKENRDPNLGVRRGRGGGSDGGGGSGDDPTTPNKRRQPFRQVSRTRLGIDCKKY